MSLSTNFEVPPELKHGNVKSSKHVIQNPHKVEFYPYGGLGQRFMADDYIRFKINSNKTIDPKTLRLHYTLKVKHRTPTIILAYDNPGAGEAKAGIVYEKDIFDFTNADHVINLRRKQSFIYSQSNQHDFLTYDGSEFQVCWPSEHSSCIISSLSTSFNDLKKNEHIANYNRLRSLLSITSVSDHYKRTRGDLEGYYSYRGGEEFVDANGYIIPYFDTRQLYASISAANQDDHRKQMKVESDGVYDYVAKNFLTKRGNRMNAWKRSTDVVEYTRFRHLYRAEPDTIFTKDKLNQYQLTIHKSANEDYREQITPLDLVGVLNIDNYMDMSLFETLDLDILLEKNHIVLNCIVKDNGAHSLNEGKSQTLQDNVYYEIENVYLSAIAYDVSPDYRVNLTKMLGTPRGLTLPIETYKVFKKVITNTTAQINIMENFHDLKSLFVFFSDREHFTNSAQNGYCNSTSTFPNYGLESYEIMINDVSTSGRRISTMKGRDGHAIEELYRALNMHNNVEIASNDQILSRFQTDRMILGLNLESSILESGSNVEKITLDLEFVDPSIDEANGYDYSRRDSFSNGIGVFIVCMYGANIHLTQNSTIKVQ